MNMLKGLTWTCLALVLLTGCVGKLQDGTVEAQAAPTGGQAIRLVNESASDYSIYCESGAPASVKEAAVEIQKYIKLSTGVTLPLVHVPKEPMIVLGDTPEGRIAGIDPSKLQEEGYRLETFGRNIFIAGRDTKAEERTVDGGFSDGTYYGAMEFLERYVGVRWLMSVEGGDDVPQRQTLTIPDISISDAPDFKSRIATRVWVGNGKVNDPWLRHMRVTESRQPLPVDFNHAWDCYNMPERLKGHPEYMAMVNGKRRKIEDQTDANGKYLNNGRDEPWKFCTTNEALIDLYASALLEEMGKKPEKKIWSIGPSDGGGWCECEKCRALDEDCAWPGNVGVKASLTPRIFAFYNEVARRIKAKQPDKILGCFAYSVYTYPPSKPMKIEANLFVVLAARPYYGYALYNDDLANEFPRLLEAWSSMVPGRLGWFDYSTWVGLKCFAGAPYPPGIKIHKLIFPALKKHDVKMALWDTSSIQGYGALYTYLSCKLMWRADADVDALANEWLQRAYGSGWEPMRRMYDLLEDKLSDYKRKKKYDWQYHAVPEQVRRIHLKIFPQMEALYKEALGKAETDVQRKRLEMFGDNLTLLHWNMRKAGWLNEPEKSMFYRSDDDFKKFAEEKCGAPSINSRPTSLKEIMTPRLVNDDTGPASAHK